MVLFPSYEFYNVRLAISHVLILGVPRMPDSTFLCLLSQLLTINTQEKAQPNPHKRIKKEERQKKKKKKEEKSPN